MIHELRTYHCMPGRMPEVFARFERVTLSLFSRHGIRATHFWTVLVGSHSRDLIYLLEWESLAERQERWDAFQSDPEWIKARAESEELGPIIESGSNQLLQLVLTGALEKQRAAPTSSDPRDAADDLSKGRKC